MSVQLKTTERRVVLAKTWLRKLSPKQLSLTKIQNELCCDKISSFLSISSQVECRKKLGKGKEQFTFSFVPLLASITSIIGTAKNKTEF
jgi:hypothetical protein